MMIMARIRVTGVVNGADLMTRFHDIQYAQIRCVHYMAIFSSGAIYMALILLYMRLNEEDLSLFIHIYLYSPQISQSLFMRNS